jgi:hypothetical protein
MYARLVVFALAVSAAALAFVAGGVPSIGSVGAQGVGQNRLLLPLVPRNAADYVPTASGTISGTVRAENVSVPSGVTLRTSGATTIQANGDVALSGAIVTDGTDLTIVAGGNVTIAGPISIDPAAVVAEESGKVIIRAAGAIVVASSDPTQVLIEAADVEIVSTAAAAARSAQQGPPTLPPGPGAGRNVRGNVTVGNAIIAKPGADGANDVQFNAPAVGRDGRRGGRVYVDSTWQDATVTIEATGVLTAGRGGKGGDATSSGVLACPGNNATATGGRGGQGGGVTIGSTGGTTRMAGVINVGDGGAGGKAIAQPGDGKDPGCDGGAAQATGGPGGTGGVLSTGGGVVVTGNVRGGNGGEGGKGIGEIGGAGANGAFPANPNGAKGGAATIRGGDGGNGGGYATGGGGRGGVGGDAESNSVANGGRGANGCTVDPKRAGGNGGDGGTVSVVSGNGGTHYPNAGRAAGGNASATASGNGGNGGDGLPNGGTGGAGGGFSVFGGGGAINGSFMRGADGVVCAVVLIDPQCAASGANRTLVLTGFAAGEQVAVTFAHEGEEFGDTFTVGADGSLERTIFVTSGQTKTLAVAAVGRTSARRATTEIRSTVGEACPPGGSRAAAAAGASG